ncbi:MAG TPA: hypothetical protein DDW52_24330 [Planctomycetaceae bacterium]|nr:hypothetical protein [Planctomycetaceae bacterium]
MPKLQGSTDSGGDSNQSVASPEHLADNLDSTRITDHAAGEPIESKPSSETGLAEPVHLSEEEIRVLWDKFYLPLRQSISRRVEQIRRPVASDSEIALSAIHSLLRAAREGRFRDFRNEANLWKLLRTIAIRKANGLHKRLWAEKRGGVEGPLGQHDAEEGRPAGIDLAPARNGTPEQRAVAEDLLGELMNRLPSDRCREVILLKLEGNDNFEIANALGTTTRTVQRMLEKARVEWKRVAQA